MGYIVRPAWSTELHLSQKPKNKNNKKQFKEIKCRPGRKMEAIHQWGHYVALHLSQSEVLLSMVLVTCNYEWKVQETN